MQFEISHMVLAGVLGSATGGTVVAKVGPAIMRWLTKRADRRSREEEKRISADAHVKVAEITAEAQRDVAEITGQHQVLSEANEFIRALREERAEDRNRLKHCEERHEKTEKELNDVKTQLDLWVSHATAMNDTFKATQEEAEDCKREREIDRKRLNAFEQELTELRRSLT